MLGTNEDMPLVVIGDADGLIALLQEDDSNHEKAVQIARRCVEQRAEVIFPLTAIVEAVTTLQRRLTNPSLAEKVRQQTIEGQLVIDEVDRDTLKQASILFNPFGSKQNTLFVAVVAMAARKYGATAIFSFDGWYTQIGLKLAATLL
jgi:predicted nucleic acid-binding protein